MYLIAVSAVFKLADDVEQLFHFLLLELLNGALVAGGDFAADGEVGTELDERDAAVAVADEQNGVLLVELQVGELGLAHGALFGELAVLVHVEVVDVDLVQRGGGED